MLTRRNPIKTGLGAGSGLALALGAALLLAVSPAAMGAQTPQLPLAGSAIPQFVNQLPLLSLAGGPIQTGWGNQPVTLRMCEFKARVLPATFVPPAGSTYAGFTWVWGYLPDPTGTSTCADLINLYDVPDGSGILDTYTGPALVNARGGGSTDINFVNNLGNAGSTKVLAWKYSTDQTLHWADPANAEANPCNMAGGIPLPADPCAQNYGGPIPAVPHLHGGEVPPELDGGPDAWFTSDALSFGHAFYSAGPGGNAALYKYPNTQEASPIWFHDHLFGGTRLNVYAGLAGAYLIYDPLLNLPAGLHFAGLMNGKPATPAGAATVEFTVPVVIQDRMFDTDGQLFFPADSAANILWTPNPEHPYWVPEFVGDTIVVNGKAWPNLNVEPKRYRFWFINGSNARTYEMFLVDPVTGAAGPNMWVIATDGGYLDAPVLAKKLTMMPGERYEVIVDFAGFANPNGWLLKNTGKTPFPAGAAPQGATLARIMKFTVGACASFCGATDTSYNPALGGAIRTGSETVVRLANPATGTLATGVTAAKTRQLTLNEVMGLPQTAVDPVTGVLTAYPGGPLEILLNNTKLSGKSPRPYNDFTPITIGGTTALYSETPTEGDTEVWEIVNLTADAHPIHLHLVQFQIVNRQGFNKNTYLAAYNAAFPAVAGNPACPGAVFCPGFGPPQSYDPAVNLFSGGKWGGNPDVAAVDPKTKKPLYLQGKLMPPDPNEAGWKDTVIVLPGQVTRLAVRWAPTGLPTSTAKAGLYFPFDPNGKDPVSGWQHGYVWHCHIVDHEDNEMMRPDTVDLNPLAPAPGARPVVKGTHY